jgi:hypothetical protein
MEWSGSVPAPLASNQNQRVLRCGISARLMSELGRNRLLPHHSIADRFTSSSGHYARNQCGRDASLLHKVKALFKDFEHGQVFHIRAFLLTSPARSMHEPESDLRREARLILRYEHG